MKELFLKAVRKCLKFTHNIGTDLGKSPSFSNLCFYLEICLEFAISCFLEFWISLKKKKQHVKLYFSIKRAAWTWWDPVLFCYLVSHFLGRFDVSATRPVIFWPKINSTTSLNFTTFIYVCYMAMCRWMGSFLSCQVCNEIPIWTF